MKINLLILNIQKILKYIQTKVLLWYIKVGKKTKYPNFYNSVVSKRIANDLDINLLQPYIKIQTINNNNNTFIAKKAKTFDEEKKVANKAPVENITIKNIGINNTPNDKKPNKIVKNFNYIIK